MSGLRFYVAGKPEPQGSKRAMRHNGNGPIIMLDDNPRTKVWRATVRDAALREMRESGWETTESAVQVIATFYMDRPKGHYGTGRNAHHVKASSPTWPTTKPDTDKLARALLDALTAAGVYRDDSQVTTLLVTKCYAENVEDNGSSERIQHGCHITVTIERATP